jgi:hypothetical protein
MYTRLRYRQIVVISVAMVVFAFITFVAGANTFDHNDFMYVATAISGGHPYKDLNFVQGPLTYWFWNAIAELSPEPETYPVMRVTSALLVALAVVIPTVFLFSSRIEAAVFFMLALGSFYVLRAGWEVGNYSLTLMLTSAGVTILLSGGVISAIVGAIFLGAAASAKISFVFLFLPGLLAAILCRREESYLRTVVSFALGASIGLLPMLVYFNENVRGFVFHNVLFHSDLTNSFRGMELADSLRSITYGTLRWIDREKLALTILAVISVFALYDRRGHASVDASLAPRILSVFGFLGCSFLLAWSPLILFPQYLAPASLFLSLGVATLLGLFRGRLRPMVVVAVASIAVLGLSSPLARTVANALPGLNQNAVSEHYRITREIRAATIDPTGAATPERCHPVAVTLSGSLLAGSGLRPSLGSHTGPFWVRVGNFVRPGQVNDPALGLKPGLFSPEREIAAAWVDFAIVGYYLDTLRQTQNGNDFVKATEVQIRETALASDFIEIPLGELRGRQMMLLKRSGCSSNSINE